MWQCGSGGGVIELFYLTVTQTPLTFRGHFRAIKILPALQYMKHISMLASPQLLHVAFHLDRVLKKRVRELPCSLHGSVSDKFRP